MVENVKKLDWSGFKLGIVLMLLSLVATVLLPVSMVYLFHSGLAVFIVGIACFAILAKQVVQVGTLKCPNCLKPFFFRGQYGNMLSARCKHCGVPIGERFGGGTPGQLESRLDTERGKR